MTPRESLSPDDPAVARLAAACDALARGDLSHRIAPLPDDPALAALAAAFNRMAEALEATLSAQQRFVADAAHELRTPLAAIRGALEVLLGGALDDPPSAHRLAQGMYRDVTRLSRLAERLLDLSRLQAATTVRRRPLDVAAFVRAFVEQAAFLAQERTLALAPGPAVVVQADPDALREALFNLVDNAAQHTTPGGRITVGWTVRPAGVVLFVADDGEGIPPQDLPHVFEPFYRGEHARSRRRGGAGLGLAIVQAIARAHGGEAHVTSAPGEGARFEIWLPQGEGSGKQDVLLQKSLDGGVEVF